MSDNWISLLNSAFLLALLSCLLYGKSVQYGAIVGIASSILFMIWGTFAEVYAAVFTNVGFFIINSYNLIKWRLNAKQ